MDKSILPGYKLEWALRKLKTVAEDLSNESMTEFQILQLLDAIDDFPQTAFRQVEKDRREQAALEQEEIPPKITDESQEKTNETNKQPTNTTKTRNGELQRKSGKTVSSKNASMQRSEAGKSN